MRTLQRRLGEYGDGQITLVLEICNVEITVLRS